MSRIGKQGLLLFRAKTHEWGQIGSSATAVVVEGILNTPRGG
jgi:hypothetical protein